MVITVSNNNAIKQYNLPSNAKKIALSLLGVITLVIFSLFGYIFSLDSKVKQIQNNNQLLTDRLKKSQSLESQVKELQLSLKQERVAKEALQQNHLKELADINAKIDTQVEEKYQKMLIAKKRAKEEKARKARIAKKKREREEKARIAKKKKAQKKRKLAREKAKAKKKKAQKERLAKKKREKEKKARIAKKKKAQKKRKLAREKAKAKKKKAHKKRKKKVAQLKRLKAKTKLLKKIAKKNLGKHYVWGAVGPRTFDCSGFTSYVYRKKGISIPRTSREQSKYGEYVKRKELKAGDLIFFDTSRRSRGFVNHVGMYLGNNKFIHASSAKRKVVITSLGKPFYASRFKWGRRILN